MYCGGLINKLISQESKFKEIIIKKHNRQHKIENLSSTQTFINARDTMAHV